LDWPLCHVGVVFLVGQLSILCHQVE
jgi:hypothetical protein